LESSIVTPAARLACIGRMKDTAEKAPVTIVGIPVAST